MGNGNSKKTAKLDAARNALKVLIPDVEFNAEGIAVSEKKVFVSSNLLETDTNRLF